MIMIFSDSRTHSQFILNYLVKMGRCHDRINNRRIKTS